MRKAFLVLSAVLLLAVSCKDKEADKETVKKEQALAKEEKEFKMYEMSQMAALMEQMYVDNMRLRQRIMDGDTIGDFPKHFLKIHIASMTDESDRDAFFKKHADEFIKAQQLIYADTIHAKERFNEGVTACLKCHESKCGGPIPRIKKLYIK